MKRQQNKGKVYLVGAGPGDPGLITVKGLAWLKKADVILYDRLIPKELLAQAKKGALLRYAGKEKGEYVDQERINRLMLRFAQQGKSVARLKGGDPFVFGRGQEEMQFLKDNGVDCEVLPGVSSCYAAPEVYGIPLTHRKLASGFMVLTGHEDPAKISESVDWRQAARFSGTIVVMMGLSNLKEITGRLMENGLNAKTPAAVISQGTTKKQKSAIGILSDIADKAKGFSSPAVCVIGEVVRMGFEPLSKKRYLATASERLNQDIAEKLTRLGASVDLLPMVRIVPNKQIKDLDAIIAALPNFDWLVFTSRHGVYYFLKRFLALKTDSAGLAGKIACVGSGTAAEFAKHGIRQALMPVKFTTRDLARALVAKGIAGKKIALLRTELERDYLKKMLADAGAQVLDCVVYNVEESLDKESLARAVTRKPDGIFFLSPKGARVFFRLLPGGLRNRIKREARFFSIGPVTTRALRGEGARTISSAREHTVEGLVNLCLQEN